MSEQVYKIKRKQAMTHGYFLAHCEPFVDPELSLEAKGLMAWFAARDTDGLALSDLPAGWSEPWKELAQRGYVKIDKATNMIDLSLRSTRKQKKHPSTKPEYQEIAQAIQGYLRAWWFKRYNCQPTPNAINAVTQSAKQDHKVHALWSMSQEQFNQCLTGHVNGLDSEKYFSWPVFMTYVSAEAGRQKQQQSSARRDDIEEAMQ